MTAEDTERFLLRVPARARYLCRLRSFFKGVLEDFGLDDAGDLVLALDESCANVLKHRPARGPRDDLRVEAEVRKGFVRFRIADFCCAGDVPAIKPRSLDAVRPGGLGTHFVQKIVDRVDYEPDDDHGDRLTLVLEKSWEPKGRP